MDIKKINDVLEKSEITNKILRELPDWFGIESSIVNYVEEVKNQLYYAAYDNDKVIGFISVNEHNKYTVDVHVMGILKEYHRKGIGKKLISVAERELRDLGYKMFMVKTVGESSSDLSYKKTRDFYSSVGFYPLEEFKEIWDAHNPCLIMVKALNL